MLHLYQLMITNKMDTFESRLQQVLTMEELSPAKFADMLGIQRSGISHLLSGRNNPSFDFITRMLEHFPELNADWLLMGKGKPYKDSSAPSTAAPAVSPAPKPSSQQIWQNQAALPHSPQMPQLFGEETIESEMESSQAPENAIFAPSVHDIPHFQEPETANSPRPADHPAAPSAAPSADRHIVRVTIFWSDGTYEEK